MGVIHSELNDSLKKFISEQKIYFTATAPKKGRINLSPKGIDTLRPIDNKTVAFLNLTGSGNETEAHLIENGRMTVMFCSFSEEPLILRLYGRGRAVHRRDKEWSKLYPLFKPLPGVRQIIVLEIDSLQTSCGHGVPIYEFKEERDTLVRWLEGKSEEEIEKYWRENNRVSIDGLPTTLLEA